MDSDVHIEMTFPTQPLAVVRRRVSSQELSKVVPEGCGIVWSVLRAQRVLGAGRHVAVYLDDQINLEVGVELESPFAGYGEVVGSELPSGRVATASHFGPYSHLYKTHEAIRNWCVNQGLVLSGPSWEVYGHWMDEWNRDPTKIRTDVFYLISMASDL
jgi:hypothetical protein